MTDRQTDHAIPSVAIPHLASAATRPKISNDSNEIASYQISRVKYNVPGAFNTTQEVNKCDESRPKERTKNV